MIVRALALASVACLVAAVALTVFGGANTPVIVILILASAGISTLLAIRAGFIKARGIVEDARTFVTGDIQHARLVDVGDPKGIFNPECEVTLELEGEPTASRTPSAAGCRCRSRSRGATGSASASTCRCCAPTWPS